MTGQATRLILTGGGSRSPFWAQMFADVCGVSIEVPEARGSGRWVLLCWRGWRQVLWPDLETAVAQTARIAARFTPDPAAKADYDGWFGLYREARQSIATIRPHGRRIGRGQVSRQ